MLTDEGTHITVAGNVPGQLPEVEEVEKYIKAYHRESLDASWSHPKR